MELAAALTAILALYILATSLDWTTTTIVAVVAGAALLLAVADPGRLLWRRR